MKISNWLKAGRRSKKMDELILNVNCTPSGKCGNSEWNDYVQINCYSKEKEKFIRINMTLSEAKYFQNSLNEGMKKFS